MSAKEVIIYFFIELTDHMKICVTLYNVVVAQHFKPDFNFQVLAQVSSKEFKAFFLLEYVHLRQQAYYKVFSRASASEAREVKAAKV